MNHSHTEFLVTLNVPTSLEEAMVDSLLMLESTHGFSSFHVSAHHHDNSSQSLSLAEQVMGRQKKIRFQMYVDKAGLSKLLVQLKQEFAGAGIHYWVIPVLEKGVI